MPEVFVNCFRYQYQLCKPLYFSVSNVIVIIERVVICPMANSEAKVLAILSNNQYLEQ